MKPGVGEDLACGHGATHTGHRSQPNAPSAFRAQCTAHAAALCSRCRYDIQSLMHYSSHSFATSGQPNIEPKLAGCKEYTNRGLQYCKSHFKLGQRIGLSQYDA